MTSTMPQVSTLRVITKPSVGERRRLLKFVHAEGGAGSRKVQDGVVESMLVIQKEEVDGVTGRMLTKFSNDYIKLTRDFHPDEYIAKWS